MAFTDVALQAGTDGITAAFPALQLYTAAPNAAGTTNESSAGRVTPTWPAASGSGDATVSNVAFTGGEASGPCTHVGLWSTDGLTFGGAFALTGDLAFNAAGEYTITTLTVNATAS